jgi:hypothetical protein
LTAGPELENSQGQKRQSYGGEIFCPDYTQKQTQITADLGHPVHPRDFRKDVRSDRLCCERDRSPIAFVPGHHGPGHPGELVGERDGSDLRRRANNAVSQGRWPVPWTLS